jgi:nudix-type nucleoside diphosphatase (YffH/AdpP family)
LPEIVRANVVFQGWTQFLLATLRDDAGREMQRAILDHGIAACVLPYDAERRIALLVRQTRAPVVYAGTTEPLLEAIAGRVEDEEPMESARREALEEAGLRLGGLQHVATCWLSPGISTERIALFLAAYRGADRIEQGGGTDEHECVAVHEVGLADLRRMADRGEIADAKTLLLVQALMLRQPQLFGP